MRIQVTRERQLALDGDPIWRVIQRINRAALEKSYWREDFRRAHYDAFVEVTAQVALEVLASNGLTDGG